MKKRILIIIMLLFVIVFLSACKKQKPLTIWVGSESQEFYAEKINDYLELYQTKNGKEFPHKIEVKAVDSSTAAATYLDDMEAGADIFTIPHDNLGKLIKGSSGIAPVTSQALLEQIANDNPTKFLNVIKGVVGDKEYTFGIPYVGQSQILYYNKKYLNENDVKSWEGILAKATQAGKKSLTLTGTDGFNNAFLLLAREKETNYTSLRLYENGQFENTYGIGDDTIAKLKWGQRFFNHPNGAKQASDSGWEVELKDEISLSTITGAWFFRAAQAALGSNLGIAILPEFTLTSEDAYGTALAGTVYRSGSFADTKMFVMKKGSIYAEYLQDIILYLSSKEVQEQSFIVANNLPAYKNALVEFSAMSGDSIQALLARIQLEMFDFGIPQPFGVKSTFNFYYYSKGGPELIFAILDNKDNAYPTHASIKAQMQIIQTIWITG